ncbi:MAG: FAD:protein FMN transferase [Methylocystaceae bacterium]|nr:FAD:protein FMN transferase [Methylocystaceae bacterium]
MLRTILILCAFAIGLGACQKTVPEYRATVYVFGTLVEIILRDVEEDEAKKMVASLQEDFQRLHKDWHAWKPGELSRLNATFAQGGTQKVSDLLLPAIIKAKEFEEMSDGYFNPAIGNIIAAWGFHSDELPKGSMPPLDKIKDMAAAHPSMKDVVIEGHMVHSTNPMVSLDFGGFGKGLALDMAEEKLKKMGVKHAVLNAGGDINTVGDHGDRPWVMAIRHPFVKWDVITSVELAPDEELYTSGNYERFREHDGIQYSHIINPATGMPVNHIVSASVIDTNGALADAAATALTVAGADDWHRIAKRMGLKYVLLIDEKGTFYANPAMKDRLKIPEGLNPTFVVSAPL